VTRGEVWLAEVGRKRRPVLVLTRPEVIDVRVLVTVAEITTSLRGIGAEVVLDHRSVGLGRPSAVNCDGLHTVAQASLTRKLGVLDRPTMQRVCAAVAYALGC
jgi:mRNA interferase MazF